jgi:uncharacterized protein (DUF1800 family)
MFAQAAACLPTMRASQSFTRVNDMSGAETQWAVLEPAAVATRQPLTSEDLGAGSEPVEGAGLPGLASARWLALAPVAALSACGGGAADGVTTAQPELKTYTDSSSGLTMASGLPGATLAEPAVQSGMGLADAARLLTQATFGIRTVEQVSALQKEGAEHWLWRQFNAPVALHTSYLDAVRGTELVDGVSKRKDAYDNHSYEAIWRQWLFDEDGQLRARMAFALSQIFVVSNIAPDVKPYGMSSYMDMLNHHAFGNYRDLLKAVTLHAAMGYYLNMLSSAKENPETGSHPNENYAREVLQLFSIGLVKLDLDGTPLNDAQGKPQPTYGQDVVKGFARAFSGWAFGGKTVGDDLFNDEDVNLDANWTTPLRSFPEMHESGSKELLDGVVLPGGQSPEKDLDDALDNIFRHPNVAPFIARQLIQRLVTSNPSKAYVKAVALAFTDNGQGVRGDFKAVLKAILLNAEARGDAALSGNGQGKLREPVIRFANFLRALDAKPQDALGSTNLWMLFNDSTLPLGQHPMLAPSVFNFFSPAYRPAGPIAKAGLVAPEFQVTSETTMVSSYNMFHQLIYGWEDQWGMKLDVAAWRAAAADANAFLDKLNTVFFNQRMTAATRQRLLTLMQRTPPTRDDGAQARQQAAMLLVAMSPDFVVQK